MLLQENSSPNIREVSVRLPELINSASVPTLCLFSLFLKRNTAKIQSQSTHVPPLTKVRGSQVNVIYL